MIITTEISFTEKIDVICKTCFVNDFILTKIQNKIKAIEDPRFTKEIKLCQANNIYKQFELPCDNCLALPMCRNSKSYSLTLLRNCPLTKEIIMCNGYENKLCIVKFRILKMIMKSLNSFGNLVNF